MASNVSDVQIVDQARLNTVQTVGPKQKMNLIIGLILGMGLPLIIILLKEFFNNAIRSRKALTRLSPLPIYGQIIHKGKGVDLQVINFPMSSIAECFRSLRSDLHFLFNEDTSKNVIALHSAVPSEGKSFCAANLASIFAISGKSVLLVGCDLRKPRLYEIFNLDNRIGLSTYLIKDASFNNVVQKTDIKNLSVVCSGPVPPNPAELLGRTIFADFIRQAREKFDYIVLDNAPPYLSPTH